jgi:hypothetical protein
MYIPDDGWKARICTTWLTYDLSTQKLYSQKSIQHDAVIMLSLCLTNQALRHEDVWGSGCTEPHFVYLETRSSWKWVISFTPLPLYPRGKNPSYPLDTRLGGPQSRSGRRGENSWPYRESCITNRQIHAPSIDETNNETLILQDFVLLYLKETSLVTTKQNLTSSS